MKRILFGSILMVLGLLSILGFYLKRDQAGKAIITIALYSISGSLLLYFGWRSKVKENIMIKESVRMMDRYGCIYRDILAKILGTTEFEAINLFNYCKSKRLIPPGADLKYSDNQTQLEEESYSVQKQKYLTRKEIIPKYALTIIVNSTILITAIIFGDLQKGILFCIFTTALLIPLLCDKYVNEFSDKTIEGLGYYFYKYRGTLLLLSINIGVYALCTDNRTLTLNINMLKKLAISAQFILTNNEWYRILSSNFSHINIGHLWKNNIALILLSQYEYIYGTKRLMSIVLSSMLFIGGAELIFGATRHTEMYGAGFSGIINGLLVAWAIDNKGKIQDITYKAINSIYMIFIVWGISIITEAIITQRVGTIAHIFGAIGGIIAVGINKVIFRKDYTVEGEYNFANQKKKVFALEYVNGLLKNDETIVSNIISYQMPRIWWFLVAGLFAIFRINPYCIIETNKGIFFIRLTMIGYLLEKYYFTYNEIVAVDIRKRKIWNEVCFWFSSGRSIKVYTSKNNSKIFSDNMSEQFFSRKGI